MDGRVFDQRDGAIRHELVLLFDDGLRRHGYADAMAGAGEAFFDILTENDGRVSALLKMYRDCHPKVRDAGVADTVPEANGVVVSTDRPVDAAGATAWKRIENQILTPCAKPRTTSSHRPLPHQAIPAGALQGHIATAAPGA